MNFNTDAPRFKAISRPTVGAMETLINEPETVLDHGHVRVIDYMGDETAIVQAARVSYGKGTEGTRSDRGLLRYLMRHWHSTPFEMCEIKLHVKLPIFVARQWIRHRTANVNEVSARYSILAREFYVPEEGDIAKQSTVNKQGRGEGVEDMTAAEVREMLQHHNGRAYDLYEDLVDEDGHGLARELARIALPGSIYTEWYWKVDLHNLLHFLRLRADPHAQKEIRAYADVICRIVEAWMPSVWEAFVDYRLEAHTFSRQEMIALRVMVEDLGMDYVPTARTHDLALDQLSKRERAEFLNALGLR